ncbi:hypothetical protein GC175_02000 [bacterium]|nr:hypothetical protein [bacterium]
MHITSLRTYIIVYIALLVLLGLTVGAAYIDFGGWGVLVALTIATVKAVLVLLYFMHLRHSDQIFWIVVLTAFFMLMTLLVIVFSDYLSRGWIGGI